ncbi:MAG: F0F1 ATP synthase subunit A [Dehalococcoidia bacterium]|nr:F0F1 ATP synthase subunit A [Dehalococcoidia bacterium]
MSRRGCGLVGGVVLILFIVGLAGGAIGRGMNLPYISILDVPTLEIESFFRGEAIFLTEGPFPITNTLIASWITIVVATLFAFAATRKMKIIPGRLQGLVEMAMETLINFIESVAGHKNGRKFLPVIATIFIFVMFNAYLALLPVYGPSFNVTVKDEVETKYAGTVTAVVHPEIEDEEEVIALIDAADGSHVKVKAPVIDGEAVEGEMEYHVAVGDAVSEGQVVAVIEDGTVEVEVEAPVGGTIAELTVLPKVHKEDDPILWIQTDDGMKEVSAPGKGHLEYHVAVGDTVEEDEVVVEIVAKPPLIRSASTDINMTLAMALIAVFFVELMGLTGRGFKHYISEYINVGELIRGIKLFFKGKIVDGLMATVTGVINVIIGFLEAISHMTRMISFAFRLFGNMTAGEILVLSATFLIPWIMAMPFYGLELLIGFIQALIFGGLTLVFASIAVGHGSEEH